MRTLFLTPLVLLAGFSSVASGATIAHPTGATDVVIRVSSGGGFVTPQTNLTTLPAFTLYGDGTLVLPGVRTQISPGPAIATLLETRLDERRVQGLLQGARTAGLLVRGSIGYGDMGAVGVSDMPTTTLVVNAGGRHVERQAYALDATARGGLTTGEAKARRALRGFIGSLPHGLAGSPYVPRAIAVYVGVAQGAPRPGSEPVTWPLARDLARAGTPVSSGLDLRCISVAGRDARTLLASLRKANDQSLWKASTTSRTRYQLFARPLLPGEHACA